MVVSGFGKEEKIVLDYNEDTEMQDFLRIHKEAMKNT